MADAAVLARPDEMARGRLATARAWSGSRRGARFARGSRETGFSQAVHEIVDDEYMDIAGKVRKSKEILKAQKANGNQEKTRRGRCRQGATPNPSKIKDEKKTHQGRAGRRTLIESAGSVASPSSSRIQQIG